MQGFSKTTVVTQFILVGFSSLGELQLLLFVIFLLLNLTILVANVTVMAVIRFSWTLHTPMYDFLLILSFSESYYTFVIIPQQLIHLLLDTKTITFMACANQLFFFLAFACTNCFLIGDGIWSLCSHLSPSELHAYHEQKAGVGVDSLSGATGFLFALVATNLICDMPFCGPNGVNHYFCDMAPFIKLACTDTHVKELALFSLSILVIMVPFLLILISYGFTVNTILKIPSAEGKKKAFVTYASHLTVVFVHYGCASIIYLWPKSKSASDKDQLVAVTYTVVTPLLSPLVYSLRNKEVKIALKRVLGMPVATKMS